MEPANTNQPAATPDTQNSTLSIDDQVKLAQIEKLRRETALLPTTRWNVESVFKVAVAALGVVAAGVALYVGIPRAMLELVSVQRKQIDAEKDFTKQREAMEIELSAKSKALESVKQEFRATQEKLAEASKAPLSAASIAILQEATKARVYIQFAGDIDRKAVIDPLRAELQATGFVAPAAERIDRQQTNQVRYFVSSESERLSAERVRDATFGYFTRIGCPLPKLELILVRDQKPSPIEIWLKHSCRA